MFKKLIGMLAAINMVFASDSKIYVGCVNEIFVIDQTTATVVATFTVSGTPADAAFTSDSVYGYFTAGSNVIVVELITNTIVATIPVGTTAKGITIDSSGIAYVANSGSNNVSVIDTATNTVIHTIPVPNGTNYIQANPTSHFVYVSGSSNAVTVIDTTTNTIVTTIPEPGNPETIVFTHDGLFAYVPVSNGSPTCVSVIDTSTNTVVTTISLLGTDFPVGSAITPDGASVYVTNEDFLVLRRILILSIRALIPSRGRLRYQVVYSHF